jgi:hypothetical protein
MKKIQIDKGRVFQIRPLGGKPLQIFVACRKIINADVVEVEVLQNLENRGPWKWKRRSRLMVPTSHLIHPEVLPEHSRSAARWKDEFESSMTELVASLPTWVQHEVQAATTKKITLAKNQVWFHKAKGIRIKILDVMKATGEVRYRQNRISHVSFQSDLIKLLKQGFELQVDPLHFQVAMRILRDWLPVGIAALVESWLSDRVNVLTGDTMTNSVPARVPLTEKWAEALSSVENEEELDLLLHVITKAEAESGRDEN